MRVALCIGHSRPNDLGAVAADGVTHEWTFWRYVAQKMRAEHPDSGHEIRIYDKYFGRSYTEAMSEIACRIRKDRCDVAIELHFNAYNGEVQGAEAWAWKDSTPGKRLAQSLLAAHVNSTRGAGGSFPLRGLKLADRQARGAQFLAKTHCPAVLWEPFFGDNPAEWEFYQPQEDLLSVVLSEALIDWEPYILGGGL